MQQIDMTDTEQVGGMITVKTSTTPELANKA